jgi:uncharacterized protein YggE
MSPELPPSLLQVSEHASEEIAPTSAFVHVVLTADRFFSGNAALEKADELRRLGAALEASGLPKDAIALEGASLDVSTGLFTKSSSVIYRLRVTVSDIDRLGDVLDAIAACKKAELTHLTWEYPTALRAALVRECAKRAAQKADVLADALGIELDGVHTVRDEQLAELPVTNMPLGTRGIPVASRKGPASIASELASLDLAPKGKAFVRVVVDYRIRRPPPK